LQPRFITKKLRRREDGKFADGTDEEDERKKKFFPIRKIILPLG